MKFAKTVYLIAGIYGLLVVVPQYFMERQNSITFPPPINHPEYYYGFIGVTVAWQIAFLIISRDPERYRPLMLATVVEKYTYVVAVLLLYAKGRITSVLIVAPALIDLVLGTLFAIAYIKVKSSIRLR